MSMKILTVDDSRTMRDMLKLALTTAGYRVVQAIDGMDGLEVLERETPDLVITDINMPDINGLELIGYVKSNPTYRDIPLIIVSTEKSEEDKKRGLALGAAGYVVKPFKKEELVSVVSQALAGK